MNNEAKLSEQMEEPPAAEAAANSGKLTMEDSKKRPSTDDNHSHHNESSGGSKKKKTAKKQKKEEPQQPQQQARTHRADGRVYVERNSLEEEKLLRERDEIRARMEAKGPEGVTQDDLMEERRAANRLSAFQSRQRRNTLIKDLQTKVAELTRDNEESEEVIRQLRIELDQSRSENQELRKQLNDERSRESNTMAPTEAAAAQGSSFPNPVAPPLRSSPSDVAFHGHKNRSAGRSDPNPENFIPFLQAMLSAVSSPLNQAPPPGSTKQQLQFQVNASASTTATPHMNQGPHQSHGLPNSGAMPPDPSYSASNNFTGPPQQPPPVAAGQPPRDNQNLLESLLNMLQKK